MGSVCVCVCVCLSVYQTDYIKIFQNKQILLWNKEDSSSLFLMNGIAAPESVLMWNLNMVAYNIGIYIVVHVIDWFNPSSQSLSC